MTKVILSRWLLNGVAALAIVAGTMSMSATAAFAQDGGGKQTQAGQDGGGGGQGGQGAGGEGQGQGGPSEDSDAKGPKAGQPGDDEERGGKPVWAGEFALPIVELGRLNVIRSPDNVLDRAYNEVVKSFTDVVESYYDSTAQDFADAVLAVDWGTLPIIDSPLQNLAVLKELWTEGTTGLGIDPEYENQLAGIFIAVAADKEQAVSPETVVALAIIIGKTLTADDVNEIYLAAKVVQEAVVTAHG